MGNELQIQKSQQGTQLTLSDRGVRIAKKLIEINSLVGYQLSAEDIIAWSADCDRLMSPEDLEKLPFILDCFKTMRLPFDNNLGIRNLFRALPMVEKTETGFQALRAIW